MGKGTIEGEIRKGKELRDRTKEKMDKEGKKKRKDYARTFVILKILIIMKESCHCNQPL